LAGLRFADYDVRRDGLRFVMFPTGSTTETARAGLVTVVSSWFDDLSATFARSKGR
jgi:hypothetical protein